MLKVISVRNNSRVGVIRANMMFPAGRTYTFVMDPSISKFKEIKACNSLQVLVMEDFIETVYKIERGLSAVEEPVVAVKVEEEPAPVEEEFFINPPVEKAALEPVVVAPLPAPEPVVDTTPLVVELSPPAENVSELEVFEPVVVEPKPGVPEVIVFSCPYCDFSTEKKTGSLNHMRAKHPERYDEYKERLGNA